MSGVALMVDHFCLLLRIYCVVFSKLLSGSVGALPSMTHLLLPVMSRDTFKVLVLRIQREGEQESFGDDTSAHTPLYRHLDRNLPASHNLSSN